MPEIVGQALEAARVQAVEEGSANNHAAEAYRELVHGEDLAQGVEFVRGAKALRLVTLERNAETDRFERSAFDLEAGFSVQAVAARDAWELFVAGTDTTGSVAIERWLVQAPHGARTLLRGSITIDGFASGAYVPMAEPVHGASYRGSAPRVR